MIYLNLFLAVLCAIALGRCIGDPEDGPGRRIFIVWFGISTVLNGYVVAMAL
jgi:hypothetical protein